ncbi:hypothetical protein H4R21_003479, partial [Coemansia helicoidea]
MAQTADSMHLQGPTTPSRQLGVARGPRRTPASRSKKPYARPALSATGNAPPDYQSQPTPGFLSGMRSLVSRLWNTSLRASARDAGAASAPADAAMECSMQDPEIQFQTLAAAEPMQRHHAPATFSAASGAPVAAAVAAAAAAALGGETPDASRHAATVGVRARSRGPTAESLFAPSPFAYNRRLATATPSVASLRDAGRASTESPALSRRHSSLRMQVAPANGSAEYGHPSAPARYVSPSNARQLLSTLGSINTPILDARSRSAGGLQSASRADAAAERPSPAPLRRLPVSLLALSDAPSKALRSPLASADVSHGAEQPRRSASLRNAPQRKAAAPSLARTIQMQQARRAVAERLFRSRTAGHYASDSDALGAQGAAPDSGRTRMRERDDDDLTRAKRRRTEIGGAEMGDAEAHDGRRRAGHLRGRQPVRRRRVTSGSDSAVKWRFSARLDPPADDGGSSSDESDEDRAALTAKVPLAKIRGGELIGLSLRPTVSTLSATNGSGAAAVRPTGFGSTRTPVPIVSETAAAAAAAPAATTLSVARAATAAPSLPSAPAPASEAAPAPAREPTPAPAREPTPAPAKEPAPSAPVAFGFSASPAPAAAAKEADAAPAKEADKPKSPVAAAPAFSFGGFSAPKRSADESDATPKPAAPSFGVSGTATAAAAPEKPPAATVAPAFSFGAAKPTAADSESSSAAPTFGLSKPAAASENKPAAANESAPAFSFGVSKPAADGASTPAFSFGMTKPSAGNESAPAFSFGLSKPATGSASTPAPAFGASSSAGATTVAAAGAADGTAAKPVPTI